MNVFITMFYEPPMRVSARASSKVAYSVDWETIDTIDRVRGLRPPTG